MANLKSYAAISDQGPFLNMNEDDVCVDLACKLFFVLDGFGGSGIGDKASDVVKDSLLKFYTKIGGDPESTMPFFYDRKFLLEGNALLNSMYYAHEAVKSEFANCEMPQRGGASGVCASLADNILTVASTGNCMGLLYRAGHLKMIMTPDSYAAYAHDLKNKHFYTAPMSGFGLFDRLDIDIRECRVFESDIFVFLTDGAYARVDLDEIKYLLDRPEKDVKRIEGLFALANERGNLDNQSALILNF